MTTELISQEVLTAVGNFFLWGFAGYGAGTLIKHILWGIVGRCPQCHSRILEDEEAND